MRKIINTIKYTVFLLIILSQGVFGQSFGKNKVQYETYDWKFIKTPHFDIYYYTNDVALAKFTADVSEEAYEQISKHFRWNLKKPISIIVYDSHNDFQQNNAISTYMYEGIGGVPSYLKIEY